MTLARNLADLGNQVDSSGTLGVGGGGTSATTANAGFNALAPNQTSNTNKYLTTNGTNTSWADIVSGMTITSITYSGDDQAVDPTNPLPVTINGSNFVANSLVYIDTISSANSGTSINVTSSSTIVFTPPTGKSAASYNIWVVSPTGQMAILANGLLYSGAPSWAGQSTSLSAGAAVSIQLTATGDTPLVYSLVSGTLPTGTTLSSSGLISGTATTAATYPNIVVKATDPEQQDASITIEITITLGDTYFPYVTMLLHGDGANGVQNNTFVDGSPNNYSVTRAGNTTQGSFSPYGSLWSNYMGGSDYLTTATNATYSPGTGDFTVECWVNFSALPASTYVTGFFQNTSDTVGASNDKFCVGLYNDSGTYQLVLWRHSVGRTAYVNWTPSIGTWYHVAYTRSSGTSYLFINGVSQSVTDSSSLSGVSFGQAGTAIGACAANIAGWKLTGYISNVRYVVGTALYTSSFTPSTTPLTAVSNTKLLSCQSNRFIDNSSVSAAMTVGGTTSVQRFSPFNPTASYSTATIGGSGYFDGNADYLNISSVNAIGTSSVTVECWFYCTALTANTQPRFILIGSNGSDNLLVTYNVNTTTWSVIFQGSATTQTYAIKTGQWYHLAAVRNGSTVNLYINGTSIVSGSNSSSVSSNQLFVGGINWASDTTYAVTGYITDVRITTSAVYTSSFTPPTTPLTAISNTQVLFNMANAGIYDNAMMNDLETAGNAQVSTSVKKFGTGSLYFNGGTTTNLNSSNFVGLGSGDFTIEFWMYMTAYSGNYVRVLFQDTISPAIYFLFYDTGAGGTFNWAGSGAINSGLTSSSFLNQWKYVTLVKKNGTNTLYIDGVSKGTASDSGNYQTQPLYIGGDQYGGGGYPYTGYIDDLRITKGYARYTANFTPPTESFPNY